MPLRIPRTQVDAIRRHGEQTYPHECCGLLLGRAQGELRIALEAAPMRNANQTSPENRFEFDPRQHIEVQRQARARGLETVGFYHSHPDHPARPSQFDLDHASWPGYSYYIVSIRPSSIGVEGAESGVANSYELAEDRTHFIQENVEVLEGE